MKKYSFYILLVLAFTSCSTQKEKQILVENLSDFDRQKELVEIDVEELSPLKIEKNQSYLVKSKDGEIIPSQITYDGKLIFQISLKAKENKSYTITIDTLQIYPLLVFGRHYPERKGDFAWENDRVGFRFYGKELKEIQAPTSALDLWYKRTDKLVLDEWYKKDLAGEASYHVDHGEGCDPYAVGQTLGAGSMAILVDSVLHLNENFDSFEVLDNGPLRITFKLTYPSLKINGKEIAETKIISLDAGSQLTKIIQTYDTDEELTVVAGFPKRESGDSILYNKGENYFVYQEPVSDENGQIYLGLVIPQGIENVFVNKHTQVGNTDSTFTSQPNIIATQHYTPNNSIVYYTGFGWNKFGFQSVDTFKKYVHDYSKQIEQPLKITVK